MVDLKDKNLNKKLEDLEKQGMSILFDDDSSHSSKNTSIKNSDKTVNTKNKP